MRIAVDLRGNEIQAAIISDGQILKKITESNNPNGTEEEVMTNLISLIRSAMNTNIRGVGVALSAIVDNEGVAYQTSDIPSWKNVHLKDTLEQEFGVSVAVSNTCKCSALGEYFYATDTSYKNVVCLMLDKVVGAGIIINGKLYSGNNNSAGNIGNSPYLKSNFESYCSETFFTKHHSMTIKQALERAKKGDTDTLAIWNEYGMHVGELLKTFMYTCDPKAFILGGSLSKGFPYFSKGINKSLENYPCMKSTKRLRIFTSERNDLVLLGAGLLIN